MFGEPPDSGPDGPNRFLNARQTGTTEGWTHEAEDPDGAKRSRTTTKRSESTTARFTRIRTSRKPFESGVEAEAVATGSPDVDISSARNRSLSFTFLPGEVTHPLTTWVDCEVEEGERAQVAITGVAAPTRYAGRVVAGSAVHEVEVGNLTPVPAVPTAAAVLGAVLAGLGAVPRRPVSRSGSLVLAGILALPAAATAQYSAAEAARTADSTADALRTGAARWRPTGRPVYVVPSGLSARGHRPEPRRCVRAVHRAVVPVQAGARHRAHRGPVGSHNSGLCQADRATRSGSPRTCATRLSQHRASTATRSATTTRPGVWCR